MFRIPYKGDSLPKRVRDLEREVERPFAILEQMSLVVEPSHGALARGDIRALGAVTHVGQRE